MPVAVSVIGTDVTSVPGAGPSVSGPTSSTWPLNSWPMKTSCARSVGVPPVSTVPSRRSVTACIAGACWT